MASARTAASCSIAPPLPAADLTRLIATSRAASSNGNGDLTGLESLVAAPAALRAR